MRYLVSTKTIIIRMHKMRAPSGIMSVSRLERKDPVQLMLTSQDHTEYATGVNVYLVLEGFYFLTDDEEQALKLPTGQYDVPLALSAKQYSTNGTLAYNSNGNYGLPGDVIQV